MLNFCYRCSTACLYFDKNFNCNLRLCFADRREVSSARKLLATTRRVKPLAQPTAKTNVQNACDWVNATNWQRTHKYTCKYKPEKFRVTTKLKKCSWRQNILPRHAKLLAGRAVVVVSVEFGCCMCARNLRNQH